MFAWGRRLEVARRFAIYSLMTMFLIVGTAAAILWARRSESVRPYFIHVSEAGEWSVYSPNRGDFDAEILWAKLFQESLAVKYARNYFLVPGDSAAAENLWCDCRSCEVWNACLVCCAGSSMAFDFFKRRLLPEWLGALERGERRALSNIVTAPLGDVGEHGGYWRITGDLASNRGGIRKIIGFMKIERGREGRGETLGFLVSEFYFYTDK